MGSVVDENSVPFEGLRVSVREPGNLFGSEIGHQATDTSGGFSFTYISDTWAPRVGARELEIVVQNQVLREIRRIPKDDPAAEVLNLDPITIPRADVEGFLATLGTGQAQSVSRDNAVSVKIDNEAFEHAAKLIKNAQESVLLTQLMFGIPSFFDQDPAQEVTQQVFTFADPAPDADAPRKVGPLDQRPERIILDAADRGVEVRILLNAMEIPLFVRLLVGAILLPLGGSDGLFALDSLVRDPLTDLDEVKRYFDPAGRSGIKPHKFVQPVPLNGVFHSKLVLADGKRALSIGSPFSQTYNDSHDHAIDAPRRGASDGFPKHDAGFAVTGPAVADLHKSLELFWNHAVPGDPVAALPLPPPVAEPEPGDLMTSMQIVRTLSAETFAGNSEGEKGILEAYLRAIDNATDFVYLETQYFTDDHIGAALVEAMKRNPSLQVIMVLNIEPDVPTYPFKQRRLITRIRKGIGQTPASPQRFGVFTRWSFEEHTGRPRILPVYVHAKAAVVDKTWATIGSANLDGLSLDSSLLSDVLRKVFPIREQRAIEVNGVMLNGVDGHPASEIVDLVRRTLWAEHLNFALARDMPDPEATELLTRPAGGWLSLWSTRAKATLDQLVLDPGGLQTGMARVLPWPDDDSTHDTPRDHLKALKVDVHRVVPLKGTRSFLFDAGDWDPKSKSAEVDDD